MIAQDGMRVVRAQRVRTSKDDEIAGVEHEPLLLTAPVEWTDVERRVGLCGDQHDQRHVRPRRKRRHHLVVGDAARVALVPTPLRPHTLVVVGAGRR